jgi:uncharacterized protein YlxW (UPF0749 family)
LEYSAGPSSWGGALRRAGSALLPRRRTERRRGWSLLVPAVAGFAGFLLTTAATTANGTQLRNDRRPELKSLIAERRHEVASDDSRAAQLRQEVEQRARSRAGSDERVAEQQNRAQANQQAAGLTALHGQGMTIRLNDAPRRPDGTRPVGATADDLVVHQQDVQAVVNALWAGSAEAVMIMGVRVISTSAVRCVGNTLLLDGKVYSPEFAIAAIGDPGRLQRALDVAEGVRLFRAAAAAFGLGYQVKVEADVSVPAYGGSIALRSARVPG